MFIDNKGKYKELGLSNKKTFTDAEYANLPDISYLYGLFLEYKKIEDRKNAAENRLASAQTRNADLPDNAARITELENLIADADAAYDSADILDKIKLEEAKEEYIQEKEQLEEEQTPTDTAVIQSEIDALTVDFNEKTTEIKNECSRLGIGDIV